MKIDIMENGEAHIQQDNAYLVPRLVSVRVWNDGHVQAGNGEKWTKLKKLEVGKTCAVKIEGYEITVTRTEEMMPKHKAGIIKLAQYRDKKLEQGKL